MHFASLGVHFFLFDENYTVDRKKDRVMEREIYRRKNIELERKLERERTKMLETSFI
jgi:hypothetical protein